MTALELLCKIKWIPCVDRNLHLRVNGQIVLVCSKGERKRLLENKAVIINGVRPGPKDEISFPIRELIFFPNGKRKCTMVSWQ